jgi:hypothetical protein
MSMEAGHHKDTAVTAMAQSLDFLVSHGNVS